MRKLQSTDTRKEDENVQVLDSGPIPEVTLELPGASDVVGDATIRNAAPETPPPPMRWFRVVKGGYVLDNGFRTMLKPGKEINDLNYTIRNLQRQGIVLEEITAADRTSPIM
jgi:hypothetical protein